MVAGRCHISTIVGIVAVIVAAIVAVIVGVFVAIIVAVIAAVIVGVIVVLIMVLIATIMAIVCQWRIAVRQPDSMKSVRDFGIGIRTDQGINKQKAHTDLISTCHRLFIRRHSRCRSIITMQWYRTHTLIMALTSVDSFRRWRP